METAEKVMRAQADWDTREIFIKENLPFIYSCASQAAARNTKKAKVALMLLLKSVSAIESATITGRRAVINAQSPSAVLLHRTITARKYRLKRRIKMPAYLKLRLKYIL